MKAGPRLPWVEPLLVPAVHVPASGLLATLAGREDGLVLAAWQAVAWPLFAAVSLVTLSPALWALERLGRPRLPPVLLWSAGLAAAVLASWLFVTAVGGLVVTWAVALASAWAWSLARIHRAENAPRPRPPRPGPP